MLMGAWLVLVVIERFIVLGAAAGMLHIHLGMLHLGTLHLGMLHLGALQEQAEQSPERKRSKNRVKKERKRRNKRRRHLAAYEQREAQRQGQEAHPLLCLLSSLARMHVKQQCPGPRPRQPPCPQCQLGK